MDEKEFAKERLDLITNNYFEVLDLINKIYNETSIPKEIKQNIKEVIKSIEHRTVEFTIKVITEKLKASKID